MSPKRKPAGVQKSVFNMQNSFGGELLEVKAHLDLEGAVSN